MNPPSKTSEVGIKQATIVDPAEVVCTARTQRYRDVLNAAINGTVFFGGADDKKFFQDAGLSFGASFELAELAEKTLSRKSKYSLLVIDLTQTVSLECHRG